MKIISLDRTQLLSQLRRIARQVRADHPEVVDVRVFGSIARGDHVGTSDVDVLIIIQDGAPEHPVDRIRRFYPYFDLPVGVDLLVLTQEELNRRLETADAFAERVWRQSQPLA